MGKRARARRSFSPLARFAIEDSDPQVRDSGHDLLDLIVRHLILRERGFHLVDRDEPAALRTSNKLGHSCTISVDERLIEMGLRITVAHTSAVYRMCVAHGIGAGT